MAVASYSHLFTAICVVLILHLVVFMRLTVVYVIFSALLWLRFFDNIILTKWDLVGGFVVLCGACIIILQPNGLTK